MNNRYAITLVIIISHYLTGCDWLGLCPNVKLKVKQEAHTGNHLRIDGIYNSSLIFYKNGVVLLLDNGAVELDSNNRGNATIYPDINSLKKIRSYWGLYKVENNLIEFAYYLPSYACYSNAVHEKGEIINDTTFIITSSGQTEHEYRPVSNTYYFWPLNEKPDSTNKFFK